tara:strand:- start:130 stop:531 length:402 start_codon:yes stop_codon:yes gene_type:complete
MFQQNNTMSSIIGPDLEIKGDINIQGDLLIYGIVDGNINCEGIVTTAKGSKIRGYIKTIQADISGIVDGNLEAKEKISLSSTAQLNGDLFATILVIEEGASFNGLCQMNSKKNISTLKSSNKRVANLNEGTKT